MPDDPIEPDDDENVARPDPGAFHGPGTLHATMMSDLAAQIRLLKQMKALSELREEQEAREQALAEQTRKASPEYRAKEAAEARLTLEIDKRAKARAAAKALLDEQHAEAEKRATAEREEAEARDEKAAASRKALAKGLKKQLVKTRVGDLDLPSAPDTFTSDTARDFTTEPGTYEFDSQEIEPGEDGDFFALTEEQAQDLYDRIGADRGLVFDPTQEKVFSLGFRPLLRGPVTEDRLEDDLGTRAGALAEKLARLEAEQAILEQEIGRWTPSGGKAPAPSLEALLNDALARKERLRAALDAAGNPGRLRAEQILEERIRRLDADDKTVDLADPVRAPAGLDAALQEIARLRVDLAAGLDRLDQRARGPARGPLISYLRAAREKLAKFEALEGRVGADRGVEAWRALAQLAERKRAALEAELAAAVTAEELAAEGSPLADSAAARQSVDVLRGLLADVDSRWIAAETVLRAGSPKAGKEPEASDALAKLGAGVGAELEVAVAEQAKDLRTEIRTVGEAWVEALDTLLPKDPEPGEAVVEPDERKLAAIVAVAAERAGLEKALTDLSAAPELDETRAVQERLAALEGAWHRALPALVSNGARDPRLAAAEARAVVRVELQRQLRKARDAREAAASRELKRLRADLADAAAWCDALGEERRLADIATDRLELKRLAVEEARAALAAVQAALSKRLQARQAGDIRTAPLPARVYFRKPELDARFENKFTASEIEAKAMSSGIDTTDFRVNAAFTSAFVSGGAGWGRSTEESHLRGTASTSRRIYVTSSFLLPKVELALPLEHPCASDEFLAAIRAAIGARLDKAGCLVAVLREFGHFVPRRLTVGGRLYSTEERELKADETASEEAKKHANEVQTSISVTTAWFAGGIEGKGAWASGSLDKASEKSLQEAQSLLLNAVGGEGGYVKDVTRWAGSLQSYTRWQTIGMADLYPSIGVLPDAERTACIGILSDFVQRNHQTLAAHRAQQFLFYPGYAELVGLRPSYFYLRNLAQGSVLTLAGNVDAEGVYAVRAAPVNAAGSQLWTISPEGHLTSKMQPDGVELALTLTADGKTVVAVPPDPANASQIWQVPPRGPVIGRAADRADAARRVLRTQGADGVQVEALDPSATLTVFHQWVVVSEDMLRRMDRQARVVYRSGGQVVELALDREGVWRWTALTEYLGGPKAVGRPIAYKSSFDGVNRVLYVDEAGDVQELWRPPERPWTRTTLTTLTDAPKAAGDLFAYVAANAARALYRDRAGFLRELYLNAGEIWRCADLTNSTVKIKGAPFALVVQNVPRVLFRDTSDEIWEFRLERSWLGTNLTQALPRKPKAVGDFSGYINGGKVLVVFRYGTGDVREFYKNGTAAWWGGDYNIATGAKGDPVGFIGDDGSANVAFQGAANQIQLCSLGDSWVTSDLTAEAGAPPAAGAPLPLVTRDGVLRVLYRDAKGRIQQLARSPADGRWEKADLFDSVVGLDAWRADSDPVGYVE